jgi:dipeptidyl aminopeptidase/acylaminoacyl peptidase
MNDQVREQVRALRSIALSPDGRRVGAMITETTANGGQSHLWLLAPNTAARQLTFGDGDDNAFAWSPDGTMIYFITGGGGAKALYRLPLDGGEPVKLQLGMINGALTGSWDPGKAIKTGALVVKGFALSPDGKTVALWADDAEDPALKARKDKKDDSYLHGDEREKLKTHLYRVNVASGAASPVAIEGRFDAMHWTDDGAMLVTTDPDSDETGRAATIWRIAPDGSARSLDLPKTVAMAALLPGGRTVFTAQCVDDAPPGCRDLFVIDKAGAAARNLTRGFDGTIPSDFIVERNGDLLMMVPNHTRQRLARISSKDGAATWFDAPAPVVSALATNRSQNAFAFIASGPEQPPAVYLTSRLGGSAAKLAMPALVPQTWAGVPSKLVTWQNEGLTIEGLLYLPKLAAGKRAPLVVDVHGGPAGHWSDGYQNLVQMLVAEGWAVFQVNPRGSTAYGQKFLAANKNDLGGADYRDIMTGIDHVLATGPLDPARTALIGYSYGGEIAGFAVGRTTRFKAIICGAPVIDQFSEYGTEDGSFYDRWYFGKPFERFQDAWRQSPLASVAGAKTPIFLLQGEADKTDPIGQSIEMWRALRQVGAPVAMMVYPREDHGPLGQNFAANVSTEPYHGVDVRRRMFAFLRAAFAGDPDPLAKVREDGPPV